MNCKYCGEAIIPCPKQPCGLGEYLHGESGMHRCNRGLTATPEPVAPAPTASASLERDAIAMEIAATLRPTDPASWSAQIPFLTNRLEAYASSQSEKLAGVGQQAAEEIRKYVKATGLRASSRTAADIIDRVIAGRVKP